MIAVEVFAFTSSYVGKLLIAIVAILTHHKVAKEGKIDKRVKKSFRREMTIGILGILFLTVGYILHLVSVNV
jgi:hypothetical protein